MEAGWLDGWMTDRNMYTWVDYWLSNSINCWFIDTFLINQSFYWFSDLMNKITINSLLHCIWLIRGAWTKLRWSQRSRSIRGSHHRLLILFIDIGVVLPGGLSVGIPHRLSCTVVLSQKCLCIKLVCILVWVNKEKDKSVGMQDAYCK